MSEVARASLDEVALRMQRIKSSAAAVRQAVVQEVDARPPVPAPSAADSSSHTLVDGPRETERRPAPAAPEPAQQHRAATAAAASGAFDTDLPPHPEATAPSDPFDDEDEEDGFASPGFDGFDDDFDDDEDDFDQGDDMAEFGGMAPAPRPMPWKGILAGAGVIVVVGVAFMWNRIFPDTEEAAAAEDVAEADESGEVRSGSVAPADSEEPAAGHAAQGDAVPGEGQPVQPEDTAAPPSEVAAPPAAATPDPATLQQVADAKALYMEASESSGGKRRKKLDETDTILSEVLGKYPDLGDALVVMAQVQLEQGDGEDALQTANHCVEVAPEQADCWLTIGVMKQNQKDKEAAIAAFERYLALAPDGKYASDVQKLLDGLR